MLLYLAGLKAFLSKHKKYLTAHPDNKVLIEAAQSCSNVREFDSYAVVPVHGYQDVDHYYRDSSAYRRAQGISVPTLAVSSDDDPVCAASGCPDDVSKIGPGVVIARTTIGGHVGFMERFYSTSSWQDKVAVDWCNSCC